MAKISPMHDKNCEAVVAEQQRFVSQLCNGKHYKADSQNGI